jgi:hypothetical protein
LTTGAATWPGIPLCALMPAAAHIHTAIARIFMP